MGKWYDACAGWMRTVDREQVFDFSVPYLHSEEAHFYVKTGNSNFDIKNIGNKKIGKRQRIYFVNVHDAV